VAHAFAYALAIENVTESKAPPRALWLRALCLERERIANHLGDLSAIGNDAGLAFGLAQFSRLKEDMLRANHQSFGHRYLMDVIVPGGLARDLDGDGPSSSSSKRRSRSCPRSIACKRSMKSMRAFKTALPIPGK
jgi:Ni,Fe-hydrogenase III large subunit